MIVISKVSNCLLPCISKELNTFLPFTTNVIYVIYLYNLYCKQCWPRSVGVVWSGLIQFSSIIKVVWYSLCLPPSGLGDTLFYPVRPSVSLTGRHKMCALLWMQLCLQVYPDLLKLCWCFCQGLKMCMWCGCNPQILFVTFAVLI